FLGQPAMSGRKLRMRPGKFAMGLLEPLALAKHVGTDRPGDDQRADDGHQETMATDRAPQKRHDNKDQQEGGGGRDQSDTAGPDHCPDGTSPVPAATQGALDATFPEPVKLFAPHRFPDVTPAKVVDKVPSPPGRFVP